MLARTHSAGLFGIDGFVVTVEADIGPGLPDLIVVGQVGGALDRARLRIRAALEHCGHVLPPRKQIVHLAPAEQRKDRTGIDLAMACAVLSSYGVIPAASLTSVLLWAELAPNGRLLPSPGTLAVADLARRQAFRRLALAPASASEVRMIEGLEILPVEDLATFVAHLRGETLLDVVAGPARVEPRRVDELDLPDPPDPPDMADIRGLELPRRAVEIMLAGRHHLLLHGPTGAGKTMLARRVAGLVPDLEDAQVLEVAKIHDAAGVAERGGTRAPIRVPAPIVSVGGMLGGGSPLRPGEVSLAHRGVLVLDELPEFAPACVDGLREPIEDGVVTLVDRRAASRLPACFILLATMRHPARRCYQARISAPLLDRLDLVVPVDPAPPTGDPGEASSVIRARIVIARQRQRERLRETPWTSNGDIPASGRAIEQLCPATPEAERLLADSARQRGLRQRDVHRMRRMARTIADLDPQRDPSAAIDVEAVVLALRLRQLPPMLTGD